MITIDVAVRREADGNGNFRSSTPIVAHSIGLFPATEASKAGCRMYAGGGDLTTNIDEVGGEGTAIFACEAIEAMIALKKQ